VKDSAETAGSGELYLSSDTEQVRYMRSGEGGRGNQAASARRQERCAVCRVASAVITIACSQRGRHAAHPEI